MANIKKIQVGTLTYDIDAKFLLDNNGAEKSYEDIIEQIKNIDFYVCTQASDTPKGVTFTPKGSSTAITGTLEASEAQVNRIYLVYNPGAAAIDAYDEYIVVGSGTLATWERIGRTDIDLSQYATKEQAGKAGTYTISFGEGASGSAGAQTASGSATVSYYKSDAATGSAGGATITSSSAGAGESANTGNAGGATVNGSNFSFTGTAATITVESDSATIDDHSYTPAGTISGSQSISAHSHGVNCATASVTYVTGTKTGNGSASTPTVTGDAGAVSIEYTPSGSISTGTGTANYTPAGSINVVVDAHSYQPAGSVSAISHASHSHTIGVNTATVQPIVEVDSASGANGAHSHTVDSHAHAANVSASKINSYTAPSMTAISFTKNTLQSLTTKNYGFADSTSNVMYAPTVSDAGVLSWSVKNAATQDVLSAGAQASLSGGVFSAGTFTYSGVTAAGAPSAATLTSSEVASHTHLISARATTNTLTYVTGIKSVSSEGAYSVTPTFTGTTVSLSHNVSTKSFSGSGVELKFTGASTTLSQAAHNHSYLAPLSHTHSLTNETLTYVTGATLNTAGSANINFANASFAGTAATISHSFTDSTVSVSLSGNYQPAGAIGGSQTIASHSHSYTKPVAHTHSVTVSSHTHSIGLTNTSVTGTAAVAVSNHTHTIGHSHSFTLPNCK